VTSWYNESSYLKLYKFECENVVIRRNGDPNSGSIPCNEYAVKEQSYIVKWFVRD
jgi:hypothetical protein